MPRVPDFAAPSVGLQNPQGPTLRAQQTQPVQVFGAQQITEMGKGLSNLGATIGGIEAQEREDLRLAKIKEGINRLDTVIGEQMEDPQTGYLWTVGKDATGPRRQQAFDEVARQFQAIEQSLPEGVERDEWKRVATPRMLRLKSQADRHEGDQAQKYAIAESKTGMEGSAKKARVAYGSEEFQFFKGVALSDADNLADLAGLPADSEQRKALRLAVTSSIHEGGIQDLVAQDPRTAKKALDAFRSEIDPEKVGDLERLIRTASIHQEGDALFQSIKGKGDLLEQMNMVDSNQSISPEARAIAKQQLQQYEAIAYQTEQRGARKAIEDLQNWTRLNREDPNMVGPVAVPPAQMIEDARKYGVLDDYTVWVKNGGQNETTARGSNLLLGLSDAALRGLSTREDVVKAFRSDLDDAGMTKMLARWESLRPNASPEAMTEHYVSLTINSEARKAGILPETYREKDLTPAEAAAFQKWELALRDLVRSATAGRKPEPQDWRDAAKVLREDAMANGVPVAVATRDQIAKGIWQVDGAVPGEKVQIGANVVQSMRADALLAIKSDPRMKDVPDWAISERQIATQVAYMVGKQNEANTAQMAKDTAASDEGYAAAQVAKRQGHSIVYNLFQNTLAMTPGGDAKKARADGLAKVDDALLRSYGLTRADAEGIADQFFRAQETIASDNSVSAGWKRYRANLISKDPAYSDQSSFWKRQREAFDRWMFEGQERARQENAARFPGDQQFTFEAVWGKPSASFMDSPSAEQMLEFQRGGGK